MGCVPAEERRRACPAGAERGVDVPRMYPEIAAIVRKHFANANVDLDELVQETAAAIAKKNASGASAYDPARSSFGHYVHLVARSKLGHMLGSRTRRERGLLFEEEEALDAMGGEHSQALAIDANASTVGELIAHLADAARRARSIQDEYHKGVAEGLGCALRVLGEAFDEGQLLPLAQRVRGLLAVAARPLTAGQMSVALGVPVPALERVLARLGQAVRRRNRGAYELAGAGGERREPAPGSQAAHHVIAMRVTTDELRTLERRALEHGTTVGLFARSVVRRAA